MNRSRIMQRVQINYLLLIFLLPLFLIFKPLNVQADSQPETPATNDIDLCKVCHARSEPTLVLSSGETISVYIDPEKYRDSVHGDLECSACHPDLDVYPHPQPDALTLTDYRLSYHDACKNCHQEQFDQVSSSVHEKLFLAGEPGTPMCTDCHQPHSQVHLCDPDEQKTLEDRIWIADTCASCHEDLYDTYLNSIHGKGLIVDRNADMPTCIDCHSVHKICDPNDASFRIQSLEMCAQCHTDPKIMDKYGQSVNVLNTYVVFHDTTVTLLENNNTDQMTSKPTCYDCHGVHDVDNLSNPPPAVFDMEGAGLYPPIKSEEKPAAPQNVAVTGIVLGLFLGGAGSLTVAQIIKERKEE
jgi:hypothetical protein